MIKTFLSPKSCNIIVALLGVFWLSAIAAFAYLTGYDLTPGTQGAQPFAWPADSHLKQSRGKFTALVFLHPQCPCSLATANELAKVLTKAGDRLQVYALLKCSQDDRLADGDSELKSADRNSMLVKTINEIPGIVPVIDKFGREAKIFGAETSGNVLLYNEQGRLVFSGGITASRGHEGDNIGSDALISAIRGDRRVTVSSTPVFGCSLVEKKL